MRRIVLFCALGLLGGCRTAEPITSEVITLFCSTSEPSKTAALSAGDEVGVFAAIEGSEDYFVENAKWVVGSDGHTLTTSPAAYYPQERQAIRFYAYLPLGGTWSGARGSFSVPTDQSTATALKQADLCWATAGSTPVATPVSLEFEHVLARLVVQVNQTPTQLAVPNAVTGGVLHIATGALVLGTTRSELNTTGSELILPAQPLTRLLFTVSGIVYVYEGAIPLEAGKTTTLNLTLNPSTKTATLSGSSVTHWLATTATGNPTQAASNTLTIHWPKCHPQSAAVNKVVLQIKDPTTNTTADYTVSSGITYTDQTFTVPFASAAVFYPYTIEHITLYQSNTWLHSSSAMLGAAIVKRGGSVVGVRQPLNPPAPSDYVKIGSLYWAKGNLVAVSKENNRECKVGAPADGGLYFQFGSLIGYKGGNQANGGTGVGVVQYPLTLDDKYFWNNALSYSWANDAMVWPSELVGTKSSWSNTTGSSIATLTDYYFNYSVAPWETAEKNIRDFSLLPGTGTGTLGTGRYAALGVGDPCTYYLGDPWRLPTSAEIVALCNNQKPGYGVGAAWSSCNASWTSSPVNGGNFAGTQLFFPASGFRSYLNGSFNHVITHGYCWDSSVYDAAGGLYLVFHRGCPYPQFYDGGRATGFPVRCVQSAS